MIFQDLRSQCQQAISSHNSLARRAFGGGLSSFSQLSHKARKSLLKSGLTYSYLKREHHLPVYKDGCGPLRDAAVLCTRLLRPSRRPRRQETHGCMDILLDLVWAEVDHGLLQYEATEK